MNRPPKGRGMKKYYRLSMIEKDPSYKEIEKTATVQKIKSVKKDEWFIFVFSQHFQPLSDGFQTVNNLPIFQSQTCNVFFSD